MHTEAEITKLLESWSAGDPDALSRLMPLVLDDLRRLAQAHFRGEREAHTLQPTALVCEVYVRLVGEQDFVWRNRNQFFKYASKLMRSILIDHARGRAALKRGQGFAHIPIDSDVRAADDLDVDMLDLVRALDRLETIDPRQHRVVALRFYLGLEISEVAQALDISESTVKREWRAAKFWLHGQLRPVPS